MTDNDLIRLFLPIINAGLIADGYSNVVVIQSNQPRQQGTPTKNTVFFTKIGQVRYGFPGWSSVWNGSLEKHTELQYYESTWQMGALVLQRPPNTYSYTASDLIDEVACIMQSEATVRTLMAAGVGILRVRAEPNPYFVDDMDDFEASPSFDFTLTYSTARVNNVPVIVLPIGIDTYPI